MSAEGYWHVEQKIYGLCDPSSGEIRYIGESQNPKARLSGHLAAPHHGNVALAEWFNQLKLRGAQPDLVILDRDSEWTERAWISFLRCIGADLLNRLPGHTKRARHWVPHLNL